MNGLRFASIVCSGLLLFATALHAQVVNGDFQQGGTGWTSAAPAGWTVVFPPVGGNPDGYGVVQSPFGNSAGRGCISQTFQCGNPTPNMHCAIQLDFQLEQIDASDNTARVIVMIDGAIAFTSTSVPNPWTTINLDAGDCGLHRLDLCLDVDAGNNGWRACFDNVSGTCEPTLGVQEIQWGRVKRLYD